MSEYSLTSDSETLSPIWNESDNEIQMPFYHIQVNSADGIEVDQPTIVFDPPKKTSAKYRRKRVAFTPHQKTELEDSFNNNNYISTQERFRLSQMLGLSEQQIKVWFQNRRMKQKQAEARKVPVQTRSEGLLTPEDKAIPHSVQIRNELEDSTVSSDGYNQNLNEHQPQQRYSQVPQQTASMGLSQGGPMVNISINPREINHQYYTRPCHFPDQNYLVPPQHPSIDGSGAKGFNNQVVKNSNSYPYPFYFPAQNMQVHQPAISIGIQNGQQRHLNGQQSGFQYGQHYGLHYGIKKEVHNEPHIGLYNGLQTGIQNVHHKGHLNGQHSGLQNGHLYGLHYGIKKELHNGPQIGLYNGLQTGIQNGHQRGHVNGQQSGSQNEQHYGINNGIKKKVHNVPQTGLQNGLQNVQETELQNAQQNEQQYGLQHGYQNIDLNGQQSGVQNGQHYGLHNGVKMEVRNGPQIGIYNGLQTGLQNGLQRTFNQYNNAASIPPESYPQVVEENYVQQSDILITTNVANVVARV